MNRKQIFRIIFFSFLFFSGVAALYFLADKGDEKKYSASVSVGEKDFSSLSPHVPGEILVIVNNIPEEESPSQGEMGTNSVQVQRKRTKRHVENLLSSKLGEENIKVDTKIFFDKRDVSLSKNRTNRLRKIRQEQGNKPNSVTDKKLVIAQIQSNKKTTSEMLHMLSGDPDISLSQPNYIYSSPRPNSKTTMIPQNATNAEDPEILWNIFNNSHNAGSDANKVWERGITGKGITVAIIDTGVDINHPDLKNNIWNNQKEQDCSNGIDDDQNGYIDDCQGWDFGDDDNDPKGLNFHGTHVAGIVAAEMNNSGVVGVAPDATIMPLKVFPDEGFAQTIDVVNAIEYAWKNDADIISTSLGREDNCSSIEARAISQAVDAGVSVFTSSGNEDSEYGLYIPFSNAPAVCSNSFATGATNREKKVADYSNYYNEMVDAMGPGGSLNDPILSTSLEGGYIGSSGTSMATPHASGIAALLLEKNASYTPKEIFDLLCQGADDIDPSGTDQISGCGFLNANTIFLSSIPDSAPSISNALWSPSLVQNDPWTSVLSFSLCDINNDIVGGSVQVLQSGTENIFAETQIKKNQQDASSCENPVRRGISIDFRSVPNREYCVDLEVTDQNGNRSNKLTNICVEKEEIILSITPKLQNIYVDDSPQNIHVNGGTNLSFQLEPGTTGIQKQNCQNGSFSCQLSVPSAPGKALLTVTDITGVQIMSNIYVAPQKSNDFEVQIFSDKENPSPGDTVQYTIRYRNTGQKKSLVRLMNTYDPNLLEILSYPSECTHISPKIMCTIGELGTNNSGNIIYSTRIK
jgi:subtilisin family serine protease